MKKAPGENIPKRSLLAPLSAVVRVIQHINQLSYIRRLSLEQDREVNLIDVPLSESSHQVLAVVVSVEDSEVSRTQVVDEEPLERAVFDELCAKRIARLSPSAKLQAVCSPVVGVCITVRKDDDIVELVSKSFNLSHRLSKVSTSADTGSPDFIHDIDNS